jgi:septum formation protein
MAGDTPLPRLVLASASPRRRDLLAGLGLAFHPRPVDLDETPRPGEPPRDYVLRLAREKAAAVAGVDELVLAADTTVVLDGDLLAKPSGPEEARAMLARIAGREHTVLTGVALEEPGRDRRAAAVAESRVRMAPMTDAEVAWYVATGEPLDKAGAYAVQGLGALFVEEVWGNYSNVVGLPIPTVRRLFAELGHDLRRFRGDGATPASLDASPLPATALGRGATADPGELLARFLEEYLDKIRWCAERLTEEQLWWRAHRRSNSVGNLVLHLAGNLSLWVGEALGGVPANRRRAEEFAADRSAGRAALVSALAGAVAGAAGVLRAHPAADWGRPLAVQRYETTALAAALHAVEHMSYHTGQIVAATKQLAGEATAIEFYPQHRGE